MNVALSGRVKSVLIVIGIVVVVVFFTFPVYWMVTTAFKIRIDTIDPGKWLFTPTLENFRIVLQKRNFYAYLGNSVVTVAASTVVSMALATPAAYGFARFRFAKKRDLAFAVLSLRMLPAMCVVIPFFLIGRFAGLLDTSILLVIVYLSFNIPFGIWMMRGFIEEIPIEVEEAAWVDGCGRLETFVRIVLPLVKPGLAATAMFIVIQSWNEFALALFLTSFRARTLPTMTTMFFSVTGIVWGEMAAVGVMTTLPVLVFSLLIQKHLVRGLTFGAVKG